MKTRTQARHTHSGRNSTGDDRDQAVSLLVSAGTLAWALKRGGASGLALGALSGVLAYRAATGRSPDWPHAGSDVARSLERGLFGRHTGPLHLKTGVTINRPPEDLYAFWRDFTRLPQIMTSLQEVQVTGDEHSRWVAKTPSGHTLEWEAQILEDMPNERIAWRSVEGSTVPQRGEVRFRPGPAGHGTEVELDMHYELPAGAVGEAASGFINALTREAVREDLRHFKQLMESGEIPTGSGKPHHEEDGAAQ